MPNSNIKKVGSYTSKYRRFLLCAGPGFGKTVFFGTGGSKVLFLTTDKEGTLSAAMMGSESQEWEVNSPKDLNEAYIYLRDGGAAEWDWVIVDNVSEAQEQFKWDNIEREHKAKPATVDEFVPTQGNYQRTQNQLLSFVKKMIDLPVNVAFTAWIATHEDNEGQEYFAPAIHGQQGQIAQMIAGYMNMVGYGEVLGQGTDDEKRRIHFSHHGPYRGKDRYTAMGKYRTDLDLPKLNALVDAKVASVLSGKTPARTRAAGTTARKRTATPRKRS